jgi:hypothetical protein
MSRERSHRITDQDTIHLLLISTTVSFNKMITIATANRPPQELRQPLKRRRLMMSISTKAAILLLLSISLGHVNSYSGKPTKPTFSILSASDEQFHDIFAWRGGYNGRGQGEDFDFEEGEADEDDDEDSEEEGFADDMVEDDAPADGYDHSLIHPPTDEENLMSLTKNNADSSGRRRRGGPPPPVRRAKRSKHWSQRLASQSLKMGSQLAWGAVQQTGKVAYQLVKPRHVEARELIGLWRLDQQIVSSGRDMASVATVELDPRHRLVTLKLPNGKTVVKPFSFRKTRLGSYQTEFVAPAFLVGDTPRLYGYRGTWQRKLADKRVIKLVGTIYEVRKTRFGKSKGDYQFTQPIGTFVARRRMKLSDDEDDDDDAFQSDSEEDDEGQEDDDVESQFSEGYDEDSDEE